MTGKKQLLKLLIFFAVTIAAVACSNQRTPNAEMINLLATLHKKAVDPGNIFSGEARLRFFDSLQKAATDEESIFRLENLKLLTYLELGEEQKAIETGEVILQKIPPFESQRREHTMKNLGLAYLRLGEKINCIKDHSGESCIFPVAGRGVYSDKNASDKAIELFQRVLMLNSVDFETRWLLNIAYMTTGQYPDRVPSSFLIRNLDTLGLTIVKPFTDMAANIGLNTNNLAGGAIIDDFNNDGLLDIVTSSWSLLEGIHYCRNNGDGSFTDISDSSGLGFINGGLNIMQTDFNNDGYKDIFVTRGGWKGSYGREPNSLLRNNGDGTFTDVTKESGLLSYHPTQTATWADFNNDGWLDVFIGNETSGPEKETCEFFINNKNGTFTEVAEQAGCAVAAFIKGVTSGDYNNDGLTDLFISTLDGFKLLYKNTGAKNGITQFKDVTIEAGLHLNKTRTFPTWFWDYDNDGWLDILVCGYEFNGSLARYVAAQAMHIPVEKNGQVFLFRNNHNGTFEEVSDKVGLKEFAFAMGSNFGDIDNDGYLDMYLGTGNPLYQSLVPNKMFKNVDGKKFIDVTTSSRTGNLQKGHGVSIADLDYDGDQDIYIEMGGAYKGDGYQNSLYINPGQNDNRWINLIVKGTTSNRAAIGTKIKVTFTERGVTRSVYRDVNSGGSFGANPLMQHIGIGQGDKIDRIEVQWPMTNQVQVFNDLQPGATLTITEGNDHLVRSTNAKVDFSKHTTGLISCSPK